jgi:hypothetical protein
LTGEGAAVFSVWNTASCGARRRGCTVRDLVLAAVRREVERERFVARLGRRKSVELGVPAAALLEEARRERAAGVRR